MSSITVEKIMCDYLTVTSFAKQLYDSAMTFFNKSASVVIENKKRMQYMGVMYEFLAGTAYVGAGRQKGEIHYMVQVSGELADSALFNWLVEYNFQYCDDWRCRRIDAQVTVVQSSAIDWYALVGALRYKMGYVKWYSTDTNTITLGNRTDATRYVRLYEKETKTGDSLLRLEAEIKRTRGNALVRQMVDVDEGEARIMMASELKYVLQKMFPDFTKRSKIYNWFYGILEYGGRPVALEPIKKNTEEWILKQVLPAIRKYLNKHGASTHAIVAEMLDILQIEDGLK